MIVIQRLPIDTKNTVFGKVYVNDEFKGYSLENKHTLIPEGEYKTSKHFGTKWQSGGKKDCLKICGVPNRKAILIHAGNTVINKEGKFSFKGCIGIGSTYDEEREFIGNTVNTINSIISEIGYETTIKIINQKKENKMAIPLALLAAPFAKKMGMKLYKNLSEKAAKKILDKVKEKTGISIDNEQQAENISKRMTGEELKEIKLATLKTDKAMFLAELKDGEDLSRTWKDDFVTYSPWIILFYVIIILTIWQSKGVVLIDSLIKLVPGGIYGTILLITSMSAVGLRSAVAKIIDKKLN